MFETPEAVVERDLAFSQNHQKWRAHAEQ